MRIFILLLLVLPTGLQQDITSANAFKKLSGLVGAWHMNTKRGTIGEEWKSISENHLQSRGYFIKSGIDTIVNETVALERKNDGIYYTSTVANQNNGQSVPFKLTAIDNKSFVFENPQHDYPKKIVYELVSADSLHAFTEGGGKRVDFGYRRVNSD